MAERIDAPRGQQITVEHLTASLAHIETWCRAVREALDSIPDKDAVRFPEQLGDSPIVAQTTQLQNPRECPPPEPDPDQGGEAN